MRAVFLADNSVIQRVHRSEKIAAALFDLASAGDLAGCLPQLLEEGYSTRSADEHRAILDANQRAKIFLAPDDATASIALDLQRRLFAAGLGRAVGVSDLQIAATAIRYSNESQRVTIVHYDADFEILGRAAPELSHRWIVASGSVA